MFKKIKIVILSATFTLLTSCAAWDALNVFQPKPSVELNANLGKNVKQDKSNLKVDGGGNTEQTADNITNNDKTEYKADSINQTTERIPPYIIIMLIFFAGWAIPSLGTTLKYFDGLLSKTAKMVTSPFRKKNKNKKEEKENKKASEP